MENNLNKEIVISDEMVQRAIIPCKSEKPFSKEIIKEIDSFRLFDEEKTPQGFGKIQQTLKIEGSLFHIGYIKYREKIIVEDFNFSEEEIVEESKTAYKVYTIAFMVKEDSNFIIFKKMKAGKFIKELSKHLFDNEDEMKHIKFNLKKIEDCVITQGKYSICRHKYVQKNSRIKNKIEGGDDIHKASGEYRKCGDVEKEYIGLEMDISGLIITVIVNVNGYFLLFKTWKDTLEENSYLYKIWEQLKEFHFILTSSPSA